MSADWTRVAWLEPIASDRPCGDDLEDTQTLAAVEAYRLFGRRESLDVGGGEDETVGPRGIRREARALPPDWRAVGEAAAAVLAQSKDLRVLAHLGAALLRSGDLRGFLTTVAVAAGWLDAFWDEVYPRVEVVRAGTNGEPDETDAMLRCSALNNFADQVVVLDGLARAPLVESRQHGRFSLRDVDVASGQVPPGKTEQRHEPAAIAAAFTEMPLDDLTGLYADVTGAVTAVRRITAAIREKADAAALGLEPLAVQLGRIDRVLREHVEVRAPAVEETSGLEDGVGGDDRAGSGPAAAAGGAVAAPVSVGAIVSRQDALRAIDAVMAYFRQHEPSSPVPLILERAKRLVAKDFLEVLADLAPDAVAQVKAAGGLKE